MKEIKKVNVDQIASFLSQETGYGVNDIIRVFDSQFLFVADHIKKGGEEDVKLDYIGKIRKRVYKRKWGKNGVNNGSR